MGRRRIAIEEIKNSNKRYVTFTKRRQGLFKKADTACRMYGSQIGVIVFSPTGRLYTSGPVDSVIHEFLHQSSSSSSLNLEEHTTGDHIEDGNKKLIRSGDDDDDDRVPMISEERETKKEEGLMMMNEFMGFEQNVMKLEEEELLLGEESQSSREEETYVDSTAMTTTTTTTTTVVADCCCNLSSLSPVASSFLESSSSDHDELDEVLHGFADYIITGTDHPYEHETTMFNLLPHQGVYDDEGCFTFCDNWPTIE